MKISSLSLLIFMAYDGISGQPYSTGKDGKVHLEDIEREDAKGGSAQPQSSPYESAYSASSDQQQPQTYQQGVYQHQTAYQQSSPNYQQQLFAPASPVHQPYYYMQPYSIFDLASLQNPGAYAYGGGANPALTSNLVYSPAAAAYSAIPQAGNYYKNSAISAGSSSSTPLKSVSQISVPQKSASGSAPTATAAAVGAVPQFSQYYPFQGLQPQQYYQYQPIVMYTHPQFPSYHPAYNLYAPGAYGGVNGLTLPKSLYSAGIKSTTQSAPSKINPKDVSDVFSGISGTNYRYEIPTNHGEQAFSKVRVTG